MRGSGNKQLREIIAETDDELLLYMIVEKKERVWLDRPKGDGAAMHQPSSRRAPYETLEELVLRMGYVLCMAIFLILRVQVDSE